MISFDKTNSGTNSNVLVSFRLDIGTFVERFWNICSFTVSTLLNGPLNDKSRQKNRKNCKLLLSSVNQRLQQKFRPAILIFPLWVMRPKIRLVGNSDNPLYGMQSERGAWETQGTVSKDELLCILEEPNRFFNLGYSTYTTVKSPNFVTFLTLNNFFL